MLAEWGKSVECPSQDFFTYFKVVRSVLAEKTRVSRYRVLPSELTNIFFLGSVRGVFKPRWQGLWHCDP